MTKEILINSLIEKDLNIIAEANILKKESTFIGDYFEKFDQNFDINTAIFFIAITKPEIDFRELQMTFRNVKIEIYMYKDILKFVLANEPIAGRTREVYQLLSKFLNRNEIITLIGFISNNLPKNADSIELCAILFTSKLPASDYSINSILEKLNLLKKSLTSRLSQFVKQNIALKELIKNLKEKRFFCIDKDAMEFLNPESLKLIYEEMLSKEQIFDQKTLKEIKEKEPKNNLEKCEKVLNKYHLSLDFFPNKALILEHGNIENIDNVLNLLASSKIDVHQFKPEELANVITFSSLKDIHYILTIINRKALNIDYLYLNPGLLLNETSEFAKIFTVKPSYGKATENFKLLEMLNFKYDETYHQEIILMDTPSLMINIKILKLYLKSFNNQNLWCKLLINPKLFKIVDFFIENGVDFKDINFNNLPNGIDVDALIKRLYIAINCKINIFKSGMIDLDLLNKLKPQELDDYICSETNFSIPIDVLEEFKKTKTFEINQSLFNSEKMDEILKANDGNIYFDDNIIVSKNKFMYNYSVINCLSDKHSTEDLIFYSLIYGSFLSNDEIKKIKMSIKKEK